VRNPHNSSIVTPGSDARALTAEALQRHFDRAAYQFFMRHNGEPPALGLREFMARFERAVVFETLVRTHGSQKETADFLKLRKQTLNWKVKKQHIQIIKVPI
jgi:DNA-binding NtrC family response regulator